MRAHCGVAYALALCALALYGVTAHSGSIELSPVRIDLSATARVGVVMVRNAGNQNSVMQVTLNRWTWVQNDNHTERSQDLIVTPTTFALEPGEQQLVRVGLYSAVRQDTEATYRLVIEEVPSPDPALANQTQLLVRHDMPVFVAPAAAAAPIVMVVFDCLAEGTSMRIANQGNMHVKVLNITLQDTRSQEVLKTWAAMEYLLPHAEKRWNLSGISGMAPRGNYRINTLSDHGNYTADVQNQCP
jgi:fimbrial chaperone protein